MYIKFKTQQKQKHRQETEESVPIMDFRANSRFTADVPFSQLCGPRECCLSIYRMRKTAQAPTSNGSCEDEKGINMYQVLEERLLEQAP